MRNCFVYGKPIYEPDWFVGRKRELAQIAERLLASFDSIELFGERRIGKTSLLKAIKTAQPPLRPNMIALDFDMGIYRTPEMFRQGIVDGLDAELKASMPNHPLRVVIRAERSKQEQPDSHSLQRIVVAAQEHGLSILLMCDEFEKAAHNPAFNVVFYEEMRALLLLPCLAMITATRYELHDTYTSTEILGSPFFNIFTPLCLGGWTADEAADFIDRYQPLCSTTFSGEEVGLIADLGGRFPYYMQLAGATVMRYRGDFGALIGTSAAPPLVKWVTDEFLIAAEPRFREMWQGMPQPLRAVLLSAAHGAFDLTLALRDDRQAQKLFRRGLIIERGGAFSIFSPAFADWIRQTHTPTPPVNPPAQTRQAAEQGYIFVSYAVEDRDFAERVVAVLQADDVPVWIDYHDIHPPDRWDRKIKQAVKDALGMVVVVSPASADSNNVMDEVGYALDLNKPVIPLYFRDCDLPLRLRRIQYIDCRTDPNAGLMELRRVGERLMKTPP
jgi:hypothetical protein